MKTHEVAAASQKVVGMAQRAFGKLISKTEQHSFRERIGE
jgi:hypothetical protein